MSGTSLDGLDLCYCEFSLNNGEWFWVILECDTIEYSKSWRERLASAIKLDEGELSKLDLEFAHLISRALTLFIERFNLEQIDFIASHGHTVHHQPQDGISMQVGNAQEICKNLGLPVINDFRITDVKLGGQGAPLVPVGDKLLFGDFDACLNLGGIANISFDSNNKRIAFDICPANHPLNKTMRVKFGEEMDRDGRRANSGNILPELLVKLNSLEFYSLKGPKSLGLEWLEDKFYPLLENFENERTEDILATLVEHETDQIAMIINENSLKEVLISGGGAHNRFFIGRLKAKSDSAMEIPPIEIIDYKEALVFAFLGLLRLRNEINTFASVTGAREDSSGGTIWNP